MIDFKKLFGMVFKTRHVPPRSEVHDLKNELTTASNRATIAAREYKQVMKIMQRNDITFQIGVVTGNAVRH